MTPIKQVDNAIRLLETEGWGQGDYLNKVTGCRCFVGALYDFQVDETGHIKPNVDTFYDSPIGTALDKLFPRGSSPIAWNDHHCQSKEQAIEKLRELRALVEAHV